MIKLEWHQGIIIPLYKGKGSRSDCNNYRGITLLSVPGNVFAKVILSHKKTKKKTTCEVVSVLNSGMHVSVCVCVRKLMQKDQTRRKQRKVVGVHRASGRNDMHWCLIVCVLSSAMWAGFVPTPPASFKCCSKLLDRDCTFLAL